MEVSVYVLKVDRRDLYVINNTTMPAILIECAFVDSSRETLYLEEYVGFMG